MARFLCLPFILLYILTHLYTFWKVFALAIENTG